MKKFFIQTFGCQMNISDSERVCATLQSKGYIRTEKVQEADLIIVNSCSVRESAENRVFGLMNNLSKTRKKSQKIILTGCMVGSAVGEHKRYPLRSLRKKLPMVDEFVESKNMIVNSSLCTKNADLPAFIPISGGCNQFCSYCVVPFARGPEKSRPFKLIIDEIKKYVAVGHRNIFLLGQNVNTYGQDLERKKDFGGLLKEIHSLDNVEKISFMTSNPWGFTEAIIEAISLPKVDRYLHLPLQSGDNDILKRMNRPYSSGDYLCLVKKVRQKIPDIQIGTDIIVGFPGETEKNFKNTFDLCQKVGFVKAYVSCYSSRPGTVAAGYDDDVPHKTKERRRKILDELINKYAQK